MDTKNFNYVDKVIANLRLNRVVDFVDKNDCVLDFGCGVKSFLLSRLTNKIKLGVGLDYDVKSRKQGNIKYINYKFEEKLPFGDQSFDKVFLLAVLEHIETDRVFKLFLEFKRILKDKGEIVLTTPTPKSKKILEFLAYKIRLISNREIKDHKKYYDRNEMVNLAKKTGLILTNYDLFQFGLNSLSVFKK
jgi:2-polyprenyl-3-methyl-5-hydroxy-6-metoxy-1,4-benzoquinol methylase